MFGEIIPSGYPSSINKLVCDFCGEEITEKDFAKVNVGLRLNPRTVQIERFFVVHSDDYYCPDLKWHPRCDSKTGDKKITVPLKALANPFHYPLVSVMFFRWGFQRKKAGKHFFDVMSYMGRYVFRTPDAIEKGDFVYLKRLAYVWFKKNDALRKNPPGEDE